MTYVVVVIAQGSWIYNSLCHLCLSPGENLPQVTDKLYHIMLYRVSPLTGITTPKGSSVIVVLDESITLIALITMRKWVIFKCQAPCTLKKQLAAAPN